MRALVDLQVSCQARPVMRGDATEPVFVGGPLSGIPATEELSGSVDDIPKVAQQPQD